jgi:import inner membrane translocase subunit TIM22
MDPRDARDLGEYDTVFFRTGTALVSGLVGGSIWGSVVAAWQDVPAVERNVALPALKKTLRIMGNYGLTYGAVAGVFAVTDASVEALRGKKDLWNGFIGGLAAGSVLGLRGMYSSCALSFLSSSLRRHDSKCT